MLFFVGCAREFRPIIIEKPPIRIAIGGELDDKQRETFFKALKIIAETPYHDYKPPHPLGATGSLTVNVDEKNEGSANLSLDTRNAIP